MQYAQCRSSKLLFIPLYSWLSQIWGHILRKNNSSALNIIGLLMPHLTELTWTQTTVYPVVQLTDLCCQILCSLSVSFHILSTWDESGISDSQNPAKLLSATQSDRGAFSSNRWEQLTQTRARTMIPVTCIKKQTAAYGVYSRINVSSGTKAWGRGLPGQGQRLGQSA